MLEQCKEIVHKFNTVYGETLTEPQIVLPDNQACLRLPGIDGKAKMSKSLGNCIYLSDESDADVRKKDHVHVYRSESPARGGSRAGWMAIRYSFIWMRSAVRSILQEFLPDYQNLDELKAHYTRGGLGDVKVKKFLNNVLQAELGPIRERRKYWEAHTDEVYAMLKEGSERARAKAAETLRDVRHAMQIDYFG